MAYLKNILFFFLLFYVLNIQGQHYIGNNLVQNPSFEQYDTCPTSTGQLYLSKHWWGLSTDYYNACALPNGMSVPLNFCGFQYAHTGVAYAGFINYFHTPSFPNFDTYMEAIKNELKDSLIKNKHYCVNYYISLTEYTYNYSSLFNSYFIYDSIGAMFSTNRVQDSISTILCDSCPKFSRSIANTDTINWLKISGYVIAKGGEKYLTIGKFNIMDWQNYNNSYSQFYVYIDDVSVCECSFEFSLGKDTTLCEGETLILNPNIPNAIYTWQDSSHATTYTVTKPGTYWVRAYFPEYDITTSSSINITYDGDCLKIPNIFTPNNDNINDYFVIQNSEGWDIDLQVYDRWGVIVYKDTNYKNNWDGKCKGKDLADGTYYYIIKATNQLSGFEKQYHGSVMILR